MAPYVIILAFFATYPVGSKATICGQGEWACQESRQCIALASKCDGVVDCSDGSDETHAVCRKIESCPEYLFRCTYGACVDGDANCTGTQECLDGSDEVLCGNKKREADGIFQCDNGDRIPSFDRCDGVKSCADGSDETLAACAGRRCAPNLFQCKYGACVDADAACDPYGTWHCVDGSDEARELCEIKENRPSTECILPDFPAEGTYKVLDPPGAEPGQRFRTTILEVSCRHPDHTIFKKNVDCVEGYWSSKIRCQCFCKVPSNEGIKYECQGYFGSRACNKYEPNGVAMYPRCIEGYNTLDLDVMKCVDGKWDREVKCEKVTHACGMPNAARGMMMGGSVAKTLDVPWHAGIFDKSSGDYRQICGGSLVSHRLVISAAHCFRDDVKHQLPHTNYAVALGQLERQWNTTGPGQCFNVSSIKLPELFQGETTLYQADIALVFLDKAAVYNTNVWPVCLDLFNFTFDQRQLTSGKLGKVAGWGLTAEEGSAADELIVNDLPTVSNIKCVNESHPDFKRYIGFEKICAGVKTGSALCEGDSGGGLVFREEPGKPYYLRGIASIRYNNHHACNNEGYTTFTRVFHYADFILNNNNGTL